MKIVIPELGDPVVDEAIKSFPSIEFIKATSLDEATEMLADKKADAMISGLNYSSRDVIVSFRDHLPLKSKYFSSCFICKKGENYLTIADGGINKMPNSEILYSIVEDTAKTHEKYFEKQPKIAMLSYSTKGSGGKNPDLEKIYFVIEGIRKNHPEWLIDGEMQLDAAVDEAVATKKTPDSPLGGHANILITPDLNSGNILYKSLERFSGYTCAGPIIQGFEMPLADLSRGSSKEDIVLTIDVIQKLFEG